MSSNKIIFLIVIILNIAIQVYGRAASPQDTDGPAPPSAPKTESGTGFDLGFLQFIKGAMSSAINIIPNRIGF